MSKSFKVDLTGQRFGRLTVLEFVPNDKDVDNSYWLCKCDCGKTTIVRGWKLKNSTTKSCGCYNKEKLLERINTGKMRKAETSESHKRLYRTYANMKQRCYNPNNPRYNIYGAKGIKICDEWLNDFTVFRDWALSHGYAYDLTIDRINPDKGYCPENCRWITKSENSKHVYTIIE